MTAKITKMSDFVKMTDWEIQVLMKKLDNLTLSQAIKGCGKKITEKFLKNMSSRAAAMINVQVKAIKPNKKDKDTARNKMFKLSVDIKNMKKRKDVANNMGTQALKEIKALLKKNNVSTMNNDQLSEFFILLSKMCRGLGILSLEEVISIVDDDFIKMGLALIVDGTDPELVMKMLSTRQETIISFQKIRLEMATTLVMSLQNGDNPRITEVLGKGYSEEGIKL